MRGAILRAGMVVFSVAVIGLGEAVADDSCNTCLSGGSCEWVGCTGGSTGCPTCEYECEGGQTCTYQPCEGLTLCD